MVSILDSMREMNFASVAFRLFLAMLCGGLIGLDRERKGRPAGLRTYMLVCIGACLCVLLSLYEHTMITTKWSAIAEEVGIRTDVSRFGAQVINGIGFLGAGTILITGRHEAKGITTAAGLWASACMGLAIGAGFYECVALCFLLILFSIKLFAKIENLLIEKAPYINIYVEYKSLNDVGTIIGAIKSQNAQILDVDISKGREKYMQNPSAIFSVYLNDKRPHTQILTSISELDSVYVIDEI